MSREIVEAVRELERDKNLESGILVDALRDGLLAAYKKTPGSYRHATVEIDDAGDFRVFAIHMPQDLEERLLEEAREKAYDDLEKIEEETGEKQHTLVTDDDLEIDWDQVPENQVRREDVTPENFGRIAAQTAKQVIQQRIREAERQIMYEEYVDRVSEVVTGIVQQAGDRNNILVDLGKVEALLPRSEQVDGERYEQGSRIKAVITEVRSGTKGPQVILSRRDPELIKTLFELEVPEIADGLVEIRGVAREPGYRSKIAVVSHAQGVDPVGACVGPRGSRVRMVVSELRGEKIDIIPWNTEPARFLAKALSPARVREVYIADDTKEATVIVPEDQLALAIGKEGLNARLAARLTGWKVDIQSEAEFAQSEAEAAFAGGEAGEDFSGRCAAILSNGKRCPNAAIPGTRFCGIPAHAALADREAAGETIESAEAVPIAGAGEDEELLADGDVTELPTPEPSEVPSPEPSEIPSPEPSPTPSGPQPTEVPTPEPATIPTPEPSTVPGPEPASVPPMPAATEEPEEAPLEERPSGIPIAASAEVEEERNDAPAA
jgi:transcription termination/antitermination protein NusA